MRAWRLLVLLITVLALALPNAAAAQDDPADQPPGPEDTRPGRGGGPRPDPEACAHAAPQSRVNDFCAALSSGGAARADYNGDNHTDLAVAVPSRTVNGVRQAGMVYVLYGSVTGLASSRLQILYPGGPIGGLGAPVQGGRVGSALAGGNFNGDGYADLAIGIPGHNNNQGRVVVVFGNADGLGPATQSVALTPQQDRGFGTSLVWGFFNGDGRADLAIGAPGLTVSGVSGTGGVWVLHGSSTGLTTTGMQFWHQNNLGHASTPLRLGERFGQTLAAGNVGRSGQHDLAIGAPYQIVDSQRTGGVDGHRAGGVKVLYGSTAGLTTDGAQSWDLGFTGYDVVHVLHSRLYGWALAIGDFDGNSVGDLAVGAPGAFDGYGGVHVLYGTTNSGLRTGPDSYRRFLGGSQGFFGSTLAAANLGGDSRAELAVGAPYQTVDGLDYAGRAFVYPGTSTGPSISGIRTLQQGADGLFGTPRAANFFGSSLTAWNWGGQPRRPRYRRLRPADLRAGQRRGGPRVVRQLGRAAHQRPAALPRGASRPRP